MGVKDPVSSLFDLLESCGLANSLYKIGLKEDQIEEAVSRALKRQYFNPKPITEEGIRELLKEAFQGKKPTLK